MWVSIIIVYVSAHINIFTFLGVRNNIGHNNMGVHYN